MKEIRELENKGIRKGNLGNHPILVFKYLVIIGCYNLELRLVVESSFVFFSLSFILLLNFSISSGGKCAA